MSNINEKLHDVTRKLLGIKKVVIVKNGQDGSLGVEVDSEPTPALEHEINDTIVTSEWFKSERRQAVTVKFSNGVITKL